MLQKIGDCEQSREYSESGRSECIIFPELSYMQALLATNLYRVTVWSQRILDEEIVDEIVDNPWHK